MLDLIATMTDLNANALEQDADDDADAVDSWMHFLRAPALTLDADQVLQSLVQITGQGVHYRKPAAHVQCPCKINLKNDGTARKPRDDGLHRALCEAKSNGDAVVANWTEKPKNELDIADWTLVLQVQTLQKMARASLAVWLWEEGQKIYNTSLHSGHISKFI